MAATKNFIMKVISHMFRSSAAQLALAVGVGLLASTAAQAVGVEPSDLSKVQLGQSQTEVRQGLGEPTKVQTYLFAEGSTWLYTLQHPMPDNEQALRVVFDAQGRVTQAHMISAEFVGLEH
jgi:outer membrane protein assembly factor BamE (lipoprotein component of BamABCDE complex)